MKQLNLKHDFPILDQKINGKPLVYLDSAATTQKPQVVIDTIVEYYKSSNSNVHRGVHSLSERATDSFEAVRSACVNILMLLMNMKLFLPRAQLTR